MYSVKIDGFKTRKEAQAFYEWYEGQGEQDICIWLECRKDEGIIDVDSANVVGREKWIDDTLYFSVETQ